MYLLHFDRAFGTAKQPSRHYIGVASDVLARVKKHRSGKSDSVYMRRAVEAGITFVVAATWPGDRKLERHFKNYHNAAKLCPICKEEKRAKKRAKVSPGQLALPIADESNPFDD